MSNLVIVAIPEENDRVWKVSSEKVPHLTLLFLGDISANPNAEKITQFVEHAANTSLKRFYMTVDRRGELGADKADVLFFRKSRYDYKAIRDFRATLLQDHNIKTAYDSATQFEGPWQPHLTLGYPATPAKPDKNDYGFYDVCFDRIAVWSGDFTGPEFLLKDYWDEFDEYCIDMNIPVSDSMAYSSLESEDIEKQTADLGLEFLEHHGVKGQKWGVRRNRSDNSAPPLAVPSHAMSVVPNGASRKTKIEVSGGENHPAHEDAIKVAEARVKLKNSGTAALSNKELNEVATRLQLEDRVSQLNRSSSHKFVANLLRQQGNQQASKFVSQKFKKKD